MPDLLFSLFLHCLSRFPPRADSNYAIYYAAASAPAWEVVIRNAGHFQYLDARGGFMDAVCAVGRAPDASVLALTSAAMVAWAETMVRDDSSRLVGTPTGTTIDAADVRSSPVLPASASPPPRLRMGVDTEGSIVAGLASWDAAERLFATERSARELLAGSGSSGGGKGGSGGGGKKGKGAEDLDFTVRLKNFQLTWSS